MKTAVISGGAGGLGQALTRVLLDRGWQVLALDLDVSHLEEQTNLTALQCDLTDPKQLDQTMARILSWHPKVDLAVYNAGITHIGAFADTAQETHRKVFEINYFAAIAMASAWDTSGDLLGRRLCPTASPHRLCSLQTRTGGVLCLTQIRGTPARGARADRRTLLCRHQYRRPSGGSRWDSPAWLGHRRRRLHDPR